MPIFVARHPAVNRQMFRVVAGEAVTAPATAFYQHNPALTGTSGYGSSRKSFVIHAEAALGKQSGINQIATQDPDIIQACNDAVKEGILTKVGALV